MRDRLEQEGREIENQRRTNGKRQPIENERFEPDFYDAIDEKEKPRELHGPHFYHAIGRKSIEQVKELRRKGKRVGKNKSTPS